MYFCYKGHSYTCNCDWLQYSVILKQPDSPLQCPEGYRIEQYQGNNIFQNRALVYDIDGRKLMTLLWRPYSKILRADVMTCQISNELLYTHGILAAQTLLEEICDCEFNAIGRLDICLDYEADDRRLRFLRHLNSNHYYVQHKSEGSTWWHTSQQDGYGKKQLHCLTWGSAHSEIKVKIYHKSREQGLVGGDTPEKPWIIDEWKTVGMDIHNVWRIEFSLCGAGQLRWQDKPISLTDVSTSGWLLGVFLDMYHNRFICRTNSGKRHGHHNDDKRVYLLDLPLLIKHLTWQETHGDDHEVAAAITLLRSMMRQIDNPAIQCDRTLYANYTMTIRDLIRRGRLEGYFTRMVGEHPSVYFNELERQIGSGVVEKIANPAQLFD